MSFNLYFENKAPEDWELDALFGQPSTRVFYFRSKYDRDNYFRLCGTGGGTRFGEPGREPPGDPARADSIVELVVNLRKGNGYLRTDS